MKPFAFEAIGDDLDLMPYSARRAADAVGRKPSLGAWRSLSVEDRAVLCALGAAPAVDTARALTILSRAVPPPEHIDASGDPAVERPAAELLAALGPEHPLEPAVWSGLAPLERYTLGKIAGKGRSERLLAAYGELVGASAQASHLDAGGSARMVSVSVKSASVRRASATNRVTMNAEAFARLLRADAPKGDVLGTARIAGILAAKRTSELIPLCHPLSLTRVELRLELDRAARAVLIESSVECFDRTGVEMEALTAASVAALTVYDMLKAFDRAMAIGPCALSEKTGGRNDYRREARELGQRFALCESALSIDEALGLVSRPEAGGVVLFVGTVRDHNQNRPVTLLEYQAYASMAVKELARLGEQIEAELPGARLAALHRTGALAVGDVAVICAASAPHRDLAFRAARLLIDRVKEQVPVWKREHGPSGPYWVGWEDVRADSVQGEPKR
jgi:molybdenum cofactor biosynthesis protein MoaC